MQMPGEGGQRPSWGVGRGEALGSGGARGGGRGFVKGTECLRSASREKPAECPVPVWFCFSFFGGDGGRIGFTV